MKAIRLNRARRSIDRRVINVSLFTFMIWKGIPPSYSPINKMKQPVSQTAIYPCLLLTVMSRILSKWRNSVRDNSHSQAFWPRWSVQWNAKLSKRKNQPASTVLFSAKSFRYWSRNSIVSLSFSFSLSGHKYENEKTPFQVLLMRHWRTEYASSHSWRRWITSYARKDKHGNGRPSTHID
jgi:hypothetical protein